MFQTAKLIIIYVFDVHFNLFCFVFFSGIEHGPRSFRRRREAFEPLGNSILRSPLFGLAEPNGENNIV